MASNLTGYWNKIYFGNMTEHDIEDYKESKRNFVYSAVFLCIVLFVAVILKENQKKFHFPFTILLFQFGVILGILDYNIQSFRGLTAFAKHGIVIQLLLPVIIYESAFGMNPHMFVMAISQCMMLALPGFAFCITLNAVFAKTVLAIYRWDWPICFLFGTILSATDPSAITELLKSQGVSPSLTAIIEGESMLNSGFALVLSHSILNNISRSKVLEVVLLEFAETCLGAVAFGYVISLGTIALLRRTENDTDLEVTFTFCIAYITYFVSELTLNVSGILAVVVLGISVSSYKSSISYEEEETTVHQFWETLSFWANSLIFTIVGLTITSTALASFQSLDIAFIIASYFTVSAVRACMILLLTPCLKSKGYGFTWQYGVVLTWGGLRGAIGIALATIARFTIQPELENKLLIQVSGVIVLTLILNAPTMDLLLKLLGMGQMTDKNMESMTNAVIMLRDAVNTTEKVTRMDKYLVGVDWAWVHKVTEIKNPYEEKGVYSTMLKRTFDIFRGHCKECKAEIQIEPTIEERKGMEQEARLLILRAMEASVANQHSMYGILQRSLGHLNTCIENALDIPGRYLLAEDVKKKFLTINNYMKLLKVHMMGLLKRFYTESQQFKMEAFSRLSDANTSTFRKWCVKIYLNRRFEIIVYWALMFNVLPVILEFTSLYKHYERDHDVSQLEREILCFEILNAVLTVFYVFETSIRISTFGCRTYFGNKGNIIDFLVAAIAVMQIFYGIILASVFRRSYTRESLYALASLGTVRLIRLLKITLKGVFMNILNQLCSVFYNAFDLGIGFIVANEEIAKSAYKIVEYDEYADYARYTAENNIYEMLCYLDELEKEHAYVACAWRTHRAAIYILRNMRDIIEEMVNIYMIDETDAEQLREEIALKMKDTMSAARHMVSKEGVRNTLKNMMWIKNDEILDTIMEHHKIQSFPSGQLIQDIGKCHSALNIIYKGIVQISGCNDGEKSGILPNTDSTLYFSRTGTFSLYFNVPESLGLMGYLLKTPSVTSTTSSKDCRLITISFETIQEIERNFGSLSFYMWRTVALQIAHSVLSKEEIYENWSDEKLKIHLEEGILPNLDNTVEFDVHPVIVDMVLVQGKVKDKTTGTVYVGPAYIPNTAKSLRLMDSTNNRPRVVMVLLREEKYHARSIMGWVELKEITYKGLCLVHGIKKASLHDTELLNETLGGHRLSFIHTLGQLFKPKGSNILKSDAP